MKLIDTYFQYKDKYDKYLILIKVGTFIEVYGEDTTILNTLFGYKIKEYGNSKRTGFPINSLAKVERELVNDKINYILIDKNDILLKKRFNVNNYDNYKKDISIDRKIDKIISKIKKSATKYNINELLCEIDKLL